MIALFRFRVAKYFSLVIVCVTCVNLHAQRVRWSIHEIHLPAELRDPNNQFSGLYIQNETLYMLPECRLQDSQEAKIYSMRLTDIERAENDSLFNIPFKKHVITGLDVMAGKMAKQGQKYEGL